MIIPIPIVIENIQFTGSSVLDFFVGSSIWFYEFVAGLGSSMELFPSVMSS